MQKQCLAVQPFGLHWTDCINFFLPRGPQLTWNILPTFSTVNVDITFWLPNVLRCFDSQNVYTIIPCKYYRKSTYWKHLALKNLAAFKPFRRLVTFSHSCGFSSLSVLIKVQSITSFKMHIYAYRWCIHFNDIKPVKFLWSAETRKELPFVELSSFLVLKLT